MSNPYLDQPSVAFWKHGVAAADWDDIPGLYQKKFGITGNCCIATAGSCFAQHISRHLRLNGFHVMDVEPSPPGLPSERAQHYGFGIYSARFGNIYTMRHLLQLVSGALGEFEAPFRVWAARGRYFDAFRPTVEPQGLGSPEEVVTHRIQHLQKVRSLFLEADVLVFTLGLTEAWVEKSTGLVFPTCPGVIAGEYDGERYEFRNFGYEEIVADFRILRDVILKARAACGRPVLRYILTVSPVPLVATASRNHVLAATVFSKSTLRAAAGSMTEKFDEVDYFPSYEIIVSPWSGRSYYESNRREVTPEGVKTVMRYFFRAHGSVSGSRPVVADSGNDGLDDDVNCDEAILDALGT